MSLSTAQTTTSGALIGVVTDASNAVIINADVQIRDNDKGTIHLTKTDRLGAYQFSFLAPANYTLAVKHGGFREERRAVHVRLGPPAFVSVKLQVATANTTVNVADDAVRVEPANADYAATINKRQISELPNPGNDLTYIAQTAPGVVMNTDLPGLANFSSLGMPGTSNLFTVNGMNDMDPDINLNLVSSLNLLSGQNQVQEATVVNIGYSAQFGGAAGALVNYITKSGGNDFHGNAQYYWNGKLLNAQSWFSKAFREEKPFSNANQWAASFGGPIVRNKLFFFFNTEGVRLLMPQGSPTSIPSLEFESATLANIDSKFGPTSASADFYRKIFNLYKNAPGAESAVQGTTNPDDPLGCGGFVGPSGLGTTVPCVRHFFRTLSSVSSDTLTSGRVDWNIGSNDRAFLQLQYDHGRVPIHLDPINAVFDAEGTQPWWQGQLVETHTFGSSAASQFLIAGNYYAPIFQLRNPSQALAAFPVSLIFTTGSFANLGDTNSGLASPAGRPTTQAQVSEDVMKIWSNHKFGFGGSFARNYFSRITYSLDANGTLRPHTLGAFFEGGVDPASPDDGLTTLDQSFAAEKSQRMSFYNLAFYAQDDWHARSNLTLTLALRAERQSNQVCKHRCFAAIDAPFGSVGHDPNQPYNQAIRINQKEAPIEVDGLLWSPRFGFAWQPLGVAHNTVIRGGIGIFYDPLPGDIARLFSTNPPNLNFFTVFGNNLAPGETSNLFQDAAASNAAFVNGFTAGQTLAQIQSAITSVNAAGFTPPAITVAQGRTHSPQYQRWSLEIQQALGDSTSLSIAYTGHHGIHQLVSNPSANAFGFGSLPAGECASPPVPPCADPRFSRVTEFSTNAVSNYNGMVVSLRNRSSQGTIQVNYTYGHALDEASNGGLLPFTTTTFGSAPQDPNNLHGSYGPADYDVRHSFNASYVWDLPLKSIFGSDAFKPLLEGWQVSGTIFAYTGMPYTVGDAEKSDSLVSNNYFGMIYAVPSGPLGDPSCTAGAAEPLAPHPCHPPQLLPDGNPNPNARFLQAGCETGFNAGRLPGPAGPCDGPIVSFAQGRNHFRGPAYFDTDFAIMKHTSIPGWKDANLGIGLQFFNVFNHPNFGSPVNVIPDPGFGRIGYTRQTPTSIQGSGRGGDASARMIQVKAQLQF